MKSKAKALLLSLCAVLLVAASVFGTIAYLTDDEAVTNTFTVVSVKLTLDEADVKTDGTYVTDKTNRVQANEYHLLPGHTYIKDPTVTVDAKSEAAYVRMMVQVEKIEQLKKALPNEDDTAKYYGADDTFLLQMLCVDEDGNSTWDGDSWTFVKYHPDTATYEFRYKEIVAKSDTATELPALFGKITVPGEIDNTHLACLKDVKIIVTAHAIQADGFDTADAAWAAFGTQNP